MIARRRAAALRLAAEAAALNAEEALEARELVEIADRIARGERPTANTERGEVFARVCEAYASGWSDLSKLADALFEGLDPGLRAALTVLLVDLAPEAGEEALSSALRWLGSVEPDLRIAAVKILGSLAELGDREALEKILDVLRASREVKRVRLAALGSLWGVAGARPEVRERLTSELVGLLSRERDPEVRLGIVSALISMLKRDGG